MNTQHFLKYKLYYSVAALFIFFLSIVGIVFAENIIQQWNKIFSSEESYKNTLEITQAIKIGDLNKEHCRVILDDDINNYTQEAGTVRKQISEYMQVCGERYDIALYPQDISFCKRVISGKKSDFSSTFLKLDGFESVKNICTEKFLTVSFTGSTFFNTDNDFKSDVLINFGLPFYYDQGNPSSEEFINHRTQSKEKLISMLEISPKVEINIDDVVLYSKQAILSLNFLPNTKYTISLKEYDSEIEGEKMKSTPYSFTTPDFQYFGLKKLDGVTLIPDNLPLNFELLSFNSDIQNTEIKICRIPNESYAKIEVLESTKGMQDVMNDFFVNKIDTLETYNCITKGLTFSKKDEISEYFKKQSFTLDTELGTPARSGLYYVTFVKKEDRKRYDAIQKALFFGVIDSHITMKISKNGEAFFFVNDFSGKPLSGQKIRVYSNEFQEKEYNYDYKNDTDTTQYFSPLEKNIFTSGALLGETNSDGILQVNMEGKVKEYFNKTLESWNYDYDGIFNSFFVTASSDTNLSYVSSKWNGGITPWNFGYSVSSDWWYGDQENTISLDSWSPVENYVGHMFPERRLYLPGEEVYIKAVLRKSGNLSIPEGKKMNLLLSDSQGKEIFKKEVTIGEFGSISEKVLLSDDASLGNYNIYLTDGDTNILYSGFNVEVFQNPKFQNDVMLEVTGLDTEVVDIKETKTEVSDWGYEIETYVGNFDISASIDSQYFSGNPVANAGVDYKVYKQAYYDTSYWDNCFYGCYWEAEKEFYTEGTGSLDDAGKLQIKIPVEFSSSYDDYKYIVEATVTDKVGDTISGTNSIIARLPNIYKKWNPNNRVQFSTENKFYKAGSNIEIQGGLNIGKFTSEYENQDVFIIKKKEYYTDYIKDVRGYQRPRTTTQEIVQEVLLVNSENFKVSKDGKLTLQYTIPETGEYVFEYGKINAGILKLPNGKTPEENINTIIGKFQESKDNFIYLPSQKFGTYSDYEVTNFLEKTCDDVESVCEYSNIEQTLLCQENINKYFSDEVQLENLCSNKKGELSFSQKISIDDIISPYEKNYFTLISYGDEDANNPIISDNKITVLSEKMVYKVGDTARILVRLPFSDGKILWTEEKDSVIHSEYIDVPGNIFFKEIKVTDAYLPNTYISVMALDTNFDCPESAMIQGVINQKCIPEYKIGYTEIIGDKTEKKSDITISPNKDSYLPRESVKLEIQTNKKEVSELTVMVVDDSLISLMGNIDVNILEKVYKKLPFQIQTSITNIAMLANYYFSRQGIVGGSGFGNFKGGDSAVSSRNIFKNTAYYNANIVTDAVGKAQVEFSLPDNLTNFRVMVVSQSKNNFFGYAEKMIEVRKDVLLESRVPQIMRNGDRLQVAANIFNTTEKNINFTAKLESSALKITKAEQKITVQAGKSTIVNWDIQVIDSCDIGSTQDDCKKQYTMSILGDNTKQNDSIQETFILAQDPLILQNELQTKKIQPNSSVDLSLKKTENTDVKASNFSLTLGNNPLSGIENTYISLMQYPYGCVEQLLSSTLPNAILQRFKNLGEAQKINQSELDRNLAIGYNKIIQLQNTDGGFKYWENDFTSDREITPHILRNLVELKNAGANVDSKILDAALEYLSKNISVSEAPHLRLEALWAAAKYIPGKEEEILKKFAVSNMTSFDTTTMSQHELLSYSYALFYMNPTKYKTEIQKNIQTLLGRTKPIKNEIYYSDLEDRGLLAGLMIDSGMNQSQLTDIILELYQENWSIYWISTKSKNAAFLAFVKYMEAYGTQYNNTLELSLGNINQSVSLDSELGVTQIEKKLSEILSGSSVNVQAKNSQGDATIFAQSSIEIHPIDPLKIQPYSSKIKVERIIYEVIDDTQLQDDCNWDSGYRNYICTPAKGLKLHSSDTFEKGKTYKILLRSNFDQDVQRTNLTLEDYLPAGFSVLNSRFLTNSIATNQASSQDSWNWNQVQIRPELVMANAKYSWGTRSEYSYFIRADYAGEFLYPPFAAYLMYEPTVRANTGFRKITIK